MTSVEFCSFTLILKIVKPTMFTIINYFFPTCSHAPFSVITSFIGPSPRKQIVKLEIDAAANVVEYPVNTPTSTPIKALISGAKSGQPHTSLPVTATSYATLINSQEASVEQIANNFDALDNLDISEIAGRFLQKIKVFFNCVSFCS